MGTEHFDAKNDQNAPSPLTHVEKCVRIDKMSKNEDYIKLIAHKEGFMYISSNNINMDYGRISKMARYSDELIDEIRNRNDIVDVISSYLPLSGKGKNYFGVCPFHDDHNPSMSISPEKQIYTCFVCGAHGNVFNFIMDYENISFFEALKLIANKVGITLDLPNTSYEKKENKNENLYDIYVRTAILNITFLKGRYHEKEKQSV